MRCATCDKAVNDFKLLTPLNIGSLAKAEPEAEKEKADDQEKKDEEVSSLLPSAFEELTIKDKVEITQEKEKPSTRTTSVWSVSGEYTDALAVLRMTMTISIVHVVHVLGFPASS